MNDLAYKALLILFPYGTGIALNQFLDELEQADQVVVLLVGCPFTFLGVVVDQSLNIAVKQVFVAEEVNPF